MIDVLPTPRCPDKASLRWSVDAISVEPLWQGYVLAVTRSALWFYETCTYVYKTCTDVCKTCTGVYKTCTKRVHMYTKHKHLFIGEPKNQNQNPKPSKKPNALCSIILFSSLVYEQVGIKKKHTDVYKTCTSISKTCTYVYKNKWCMDVYKTCLDVYKTCMSVSKTFKSLASCRDVGVSFVPLILNLWVV